MKFNAAALVAAANDLDEKEKKVHADGGLKAAVAKALAKQKPSDKESRFTGGKLDLYLS